ncbi:hypothetical protein GEV43_41885 [Actinomadura sp. J1-007]|nr:hypothetical protein [Actinomadura sp. J1-007]
MRTDRTHRNGRPGAYVTLTITNAFVPNKFPTNVFASARPAPGGSGRAAGPDLSPARRGRAFPRSR